MNALPAFSAFGIELEYMIVERASLAIRPIADRLLRDDQGRVVNELPRGHLARSNELTLHVLELKNVVPDPDLAALLPQFMHEIRAINQALAGEGACLMPGGMHPWMDPARETQLWPHTHAEIYQAYDRLFDCRQHGFANLQSMHLNLPFADDREFARLHAAVRLLLPILPALAASSPIRDGRRAEAVDARMAAYAMHQAGLPASLGALIPDTATSRADYEAHVLAPLYAELAAHDPQGILRHEWLNARAAIPRFDRMALEIRVLDMQECPRADLAIASAAIAVLERLYAESNCSLAEQQALPTVALADILRACIREAEQARIEDAEYLHCLGYPGLRCRAGELWAHLLETVFRVIPAPWREPLNVLREEGPLARRILRALGPDGERGRMAAIYRNLCDCLAEGRMFLGLE